MITDLNSQGIRPLGGARRRLATEASTFSAGKQHVIKPLMVRIGMEEQTAHPNNAANEQAIDGETLFRMWLFAGPLNPGYVVGIVVGHQQLGLFLFAGVFISLCALLYLTFASNWPPSGFMKLMASWFLLFQAVSIGPVMLISSVFGTLIELVAAFIGYGIFIVAWFMASAVLAAGAAATSKLILETRARKLRTEI